MPKGYEKMRDAIKKKMLKKGVSPTKADKEAKRIAAATSESPDCSICQHSWCLPVHKALYKNVGDSCVQIVSINSSD